MSVNTFLYFPIVFLPSGGYTVIRGNDNTEDESVEQQTNKRRHKPVYLWLNEDLSEALTRACGVTRLSKTALLTLALENDLKVKGFWPPKVRKAKQSVEV